MLRTYLCCCKSPGRAQDGREPGPCWLLSSSCENHQALPLLISESPKASCNNRRETRLHNPHPHRLGEQVRGKQKYGGEEGEGYGGGMQGGKEDFSLHSPLSHSKRNPNTNFIISPRHKWHALQISYFKVFLGGVLQIFILFYFTRASPVYSQLLLQ